MKATCKLVVEYRDKFAAERILGAVNVDDFDFVNSRVKDDTLVADIRSSSLSSLLHIVDDYLACLSIAEKVVNNN